MPKKARGPSEYGAYRRFFIGLYIAFWVVGAGLAIASVVVELFFQGGADAAPPPPQDLLACNADVRELLEDLRKTSLDVQARATLEDAAALEARWTTFQTAWQARWRALDERCGFEKMADTGLGRAYDRTARVHRALPPMQLKYSELHRRFTDELAEELREMELALARSRELLQGAAAP